MKNPATGVPATVKKGVAIPKETPFFVTESKKGAVFADLLPFSLEGSSPM